MNIARKSIRKAAISPQPLVPTTAFLSSHALQKYHFGIRAKRERYRHKFNKVYLKNSTFTSR